MQCRHSYAPLCGAMFEILAIPLFISPSYSLPLILCDILNPSQITFNSPTIDMIYRITVFQIEDNPIESSGIPIRLKQN